MQRPVGGDESLRAALQGDARQNRIEGPKGGIQLEERQTTLQIVRRRDQQAERGHVVTRDAGGVRPATALGTDVGELLNHLDRRGRVDSPVGVCGQQPPAGVAQGCSSPTA